MQLTDRSVLVDDMSLTQTRRSAARHNPRLQITVNGLYKTELIRQQGPWKSVDDVELATLSWVTWFNTVRLHGTLNDIPPSEYEAAHYVHHTETNQPVGIQ